MKQFVKTLTLSLAALAISTSAFAGTIMQFQEFGGFNTPFSFAENVGNTQTTISGSKLMTVSIDPAFCANVGCAGVNPAGEVFLLTLNASSILGTLAVNGTSVTEGFQGSFSFIGTGAHSGLNLLTVSFTDLLQGSIGGGNPTLQASQPPDSFLGSSSVFGSLNPPRGFSFGFSNLTNGGLQIQGNSIRGGGVADLAGTINATAAVPEPTTMVLLGTGLLAVARRLKTRQ